MGAGKSLVSGLHTVALHKFKGVQMSHHQITFLDFKKSEFVEKAILKRIHKLETFFQSIISCKVTVSCPHRHSKSHRVYQLEILITIPNEEPIVVRSSSERAARGLYVAIRDSFDTAERLLQKHVQHLRKFENLTLSDLEPVQ